MTIRTTRASVTFKMPFQLTGFDQLPAGTYEVDTDEQAFEGNIHTVYQRVGTMLRISTALGFQGHPIDPEDLERALERDAQAKKSVLTAPAPQDTSDLPRTEKQQWHWMPPFVRSLISMGRA